MSFSNEKFAFWAIREKGIRTDPAEIAPIQTLKTSQSLKEVRRVIGISSWCRRFVTKKACELLKQRLTEAPILACPNFTKTFTLQTYGSDYGLGAALMQKVEEVQRNGITQLLRKSVWPSFEASER